MGSPQLPAPPRPYLSFSLLEGPLAFTWSPLSPFWDSAPMMPPSTFIENGTDPEKLTLSSSGHLHYNSDLISFDSFSQIAFDIWNHWEE